MKSKKMKNMPKLQITLNNWNNWLVKTYTTS